MEINDRWSMCAPAGHTSQRRMGWFTISQTDGASSRPLRERSFSTRGRSISMSQRRHWTPLPNR